MRPLIGKRGQPNERVFKELFYHYCREMPEWFTAAGIDRHITFHNLRHTYATLQLTAGTPLEVVQTMLGHRDIRSTQIYGKIVDAKKKEATNKITLK